MTYVTYYTCDGCGKKGEIESMKFELDDESEVSHNERYHFCNFSCLKKFVMNGGNAKGKVK